MRKWSKRAWVILSITLLMSLPTVTGLSLPDTQAKWQNESHYFEWKALYTNIGRSLLWRDPKGVWWVSHRIQDKPTKLGTYKEFRERRAK